MINIARIQNSKSNTSRRNAINPEPGTEWSKVDEIIYKANENIIAEYKKVHAIYESRERVRNTQLALPPTLAELVSMIRDEPTQQTLDANPLSLTQAEIEVKTLTR
jgi:hypothetical protein